MQAKSPDDPLFAVFNALRRITQAVRRSSTEVQDVLGITGAQLFVMQQLAEQPGASMRVLAERTLTDQSSVSAVVSRLVSAGYVARRISPADARRTELTLTAGGRTLLRRAPQLAQPQLLSALQSVSAAQLRTTARVLEQAAAALGSTSEPAPMFFEPTERRRRVAARLPPKPHRRAQPGARARSQASARPQPGVRSRARAR